MRYLQARREELQPPKGKFRVIGVDLKEGPPANFHLGDFESLTAAQKLAKQKAGIGSPIYIYNDKAELVVRYGSWH
jgi:hypothetical protein